MYPTSTFLGTEYWPPVDATGQTDSTTAINLALMTAGLNRGGVVRLPPGIIKIGSEAGVTVAGQASLGSNTITCSTTGITVGMAVIDLTHPLRIQPGTFITAVNTTLGTVTVSSPIQVAFTTDSLLFEYDLIPLPVGVSLVGAGMGVVNDPVVGITGTGTSPGNALTLSSGAGVVNGMAIYDVVHPSYIPSGTTVLSGGGTTSITLSNNLAGSPLSDQLTFSYVGPWPANNYGTTLDYRGSGAAVQIRDVNWASQVNVPGAGSTSSTGGDLAHLTITLQNTNAPTAHGINIGDILNSRIESVRVVHANGGTPGSYAARSGANQIGMLAININGFTEKNVSTNLVLEDCADAFVIDGNNGTYGATSPSYEYNKFSWVPKLQCPQNGITLMRAAVVGGCSLHIKGNYYRGSIGVSSGTMLDFGGSDNSAIKANSGLEITLQMEQDVMSGVSPTTASFSTSSLMQIEAFGSMIFAGAWTQSNFGSIPAGTFTFFGITSGDSTLPASTASVTAGDPSIVVTGGLGATPSIETGSLDAIATNHPPTSAVAMNSNKITNLANGSASSDAAAFGQIPIPANGYGVTGNTGLAPTPAVDLNSTTQVLSSDSSALAMGANTIMTTASLAPGLYLVVATVTYAVAANAVHVDTYIVAGTATASLTGLAVSSQSITTGPTAVTISGLINVSGAGTVVLTAYATASSSGVVVKAATVAGAARSGATSITYTRIA